MLKYCIVALLFVFGCSSSDHIYRIETKSGQFLYSEDRPTPVKDTNLYLLEDLDGNVHHLD